MIEVANLSKRYGDLAAVQDLSFAAQPGEILGFLGPNGAGKTTTLRVITGFLPATSGTVRVCGFDVFEQSAEVRRRIGYLPENPPLYNDMTVVPYLRFAAKHPRRRARGRSATAIERVLDTCGLTERHRTPARASLEGLPPARRARAGAHPRPRGADPRRAHQRARSRADPRDARLHPVDGRRSARSCSPRTSCRRC